LFGTLFEDRYNSLSVSSHKPFVESKQAKIIFHDVYPLFSPFTVAVVAVVVVLFTDIRN